MDVLKNTQSKNDFIFFVRGLKSIQSGAMIYAIVMSIVFIPLIIIELYVMIDPFGFSRLFGQGTATLVGLIGIVLLVMMLVGFIQVLEGLRKVATGAYDVAVQGVIKNARVPLIICAVIMGIIVLMSFMGANRNSLGFRVVLNWGYLISLVIHLVMMARLAELIGVYLKNAEIETKGATLKKIFFAVSALTLFLNVLPQLISGAGMSAVYVMLVLAIGIQVFMLFSMFKYSALYKFISLNAKPVTETEGSSDADHSVSGQSDQLV